MRDRLRRLLAEGCWFPLLQRGIGFLDRWLSVGNYFIRWLRDRSVASQSPRKGPPGAAELYILLTLGVGLAWWRFIGYAPIPRLNTSGARTLGAFAATYRVLEIWIVSLNWIFVAQSPLADEQRSLACFFLNLIEIAVYSTIAMLLSGCPMASLNNNLAAVFRLGLTLTDTWPCQVIAYGQLFVSTTVLSVVVANLVGRVKHPEKPVDRRT